MGHFRVLISCLLSWDLYREITDHVRKSIIGLPRIYTSIAGPYPGGGVERVGGGSSAPSILYTSNYRVPPAHRFHKYKLRLLYFRMQKLTPYSIKFIKKNSGGACQ